MRKLLLILLLIPIVSFAQKKDYKNFDKAVKYNNDGNTEKAIKFANKAMENSPYWSKPNLLLASIYANDKQIELAANFLLKVYDETDPKDVKGIEQLTKLYYSNGFYDEALFYAEKIIAQDTNRYRFNTKINRYIDNCRFAIQALKNPSDINFQNIGKLVNSEMSEHVNAITVDSEKLLFTRRLEANKLRDQEDLFVYNFSNKTVSNLPFNTNKNEGAITVSADGSMYVYTACDRQNSIGGCDLYIRQYSDTDGWSQEYNLGENVNSERWESQACFSPDGKYLYFISNRNGGVGQEDIWRSEITKEGFSQAENLGNTINTNKAEMSPFLHSNNVTLYFASQGHIGMGSDDLFVSRRITTDGEWNTPKNMGYPINTHNSENSLIVASDGKTAYYTSDNSGFGQEDIFVFALPKHVQTSEITILEMEIITAKVGEEVILKNVSFASNSAEIDATSFDELDKLIIYLKKNPHINIEIQGHTDNVGSEADNQILSEKRAKVVFNYLNTKVENKLIYKGFGESIPLSDDKKTNRRTSFVIIE
jgi:outer membrane protein OmpA-like peptidoglycan-associated protein/tetratricopeptide (TPR) repeat protein